MAKLTRPSTNLLPMEDIADELEYIHGFQKTDGVAKDVSYVSGILSNKIAVAYDEEDKDLSNPRQTVLNAKNLNGISGDEYVTKENMQNQEHNVSVVQRDYLREIRYLREEMYDIKNELGKKGLLSNPHGYRGIIDLFSNKEVKYYKEKICSILGSYSYGNNTLAVESPSEFMTGDFIVIKKQKDNVQLVSRIVNKEEDTIEIYPSLNFDLAFDEGEIYKSLGNYYFNSYQFANIGYNQPSQNTRYSTLRDDRNWKSIDIRSAGTGYANSFYVDGDPNDDVYLATYGIHAKTIGNPGNIICYIIKESDVEKFRIGNASEELEVFYQSKPTSAEQGRGSAWAKYTFEFDNYNPYPRLKQGEKYVAIIVGLDGGQHNVDVPDSTGNFNFWSIKAIQSEESSVQQNYIFYNYGLEDGIKKLITNESINNKDIYHVVGTKLITEDDIYPYTQGLYTTEIKKNGQDKIHTIQAMLRIKKEGYAKVDIASSFGSINDGGSIRIQEDYESGKSHINFMDIAANSEIIIGQNPRRVLGYNSGTVQIEKGLYIERDYLPVYKNNYTIHARGYQILNGEKVFDEDLIPLEIKEVMLDSASPSKQSDRLIFKGEVEKNYDGLVLQIKWENSRAIPGDNAYYGAIEDLVLTYDAEMDFK